VKSAAATPTRKLAFTPPKPGSEAKRSEPPQLGGAHLLARSDGASARVADQTRTLRGNLGEPTGLKPTSYSVAGHPSMLQFSIGSSAVQAEASPNADAIQVAEVRSTDISTLRSIERIAKKTALERIGPQEAREKGFLVSAYDLPKYLDFLSKPDCKMFSAKDAAGEVVGFTMVYGDSVVDPADPTQELNHTVVDQISRQTGAKTLVIKQVGVDPEAGRKGIGSQMYQAVAEAARQDGYDYLYAAVVNDAPMLGTRFEHSNCVPNAVSEHFHLKNDFARITPEGFYYACELDGSKIGPSGMHCRDAYVRPLGSAPVPEITIATANLPSTHNG